MAALQSQIIMSCFLLLSRLYFNISFVYASQKQANHHHALAVNSPLPAPTCKASSKGHPMQITHRYGPCSPLGQDNLSPDRYQTLVQDQLRVEYINSRNLNDKYNTDTYGLNVRLKVSGTRGAGNYVVTVGFGTPKRDFTLIFDSGSEITWIQCQPRSVNCCKQQEPIFDPSGSSSFTNAPCSDGSQCPYDIKYHDGSYSNGYLGRDTLTLSPSDVYPDFVFGCSQNNSDDFDGAAGLLGFGQGKYSLISQTANDLVRIFCYCLPATDSSTGYLSFGAQALMSCDAGIIVPLIISPSRPDLYFVNLIGVTIDQHRIDIDDSQMSLSTNTVIDSATVITRLPPSVYDSLRSIFEQMMSRYPRAPSSPPLLNACYDLRGYDYSKIVPKMVLHFANENDVDLDPNGVIRKESDSQFCFAFARNNDPSEKTIIGNQQQRGLSVLYNINGGLIQFKTGCDN